MTTLTNFQIYDLLNRPCPLWLVKIDLSGADVTSANLEEVILTGVIMLAGARYKPAPAKSGAG